MTPMNESGIVRMTMNGSSSDSNWLAMTVKTRNAARMIIIPKFRTASIMSSIAPE